MSLWIIRILFLLMCTLGGYAVSQVRPELVQNGALGCLIGFGFGGVLIGVDEMLKGFSLRAFRPQPLACFWERSRPGPSTTPAYSFTSMKSRHAGSFGCACSYPLGTWE